MIIGSETAFVSGNGDAGGAYIFKFGSSWFDFDGDEKTDVSIFRPSNAQWRINRSSDASTFSYSFGESTDRIVPADFTGDGKADIAVWRPSTGKCFIQRSEDNSYYSVPFSAPGDLPAPGDYDGDGRFDLGVFRSSNATWYLNRSASSGAIQQFGVSGDKPVPNAFVP